MNEHGPERRSTRRSQTGQRFAKRLSEIFPLASSPRERRSALPWIRCRSEWRHSVFQARCLMSLAPRPFETVCSGLMPALGTGSSSAGRCS